MDAEAPILAAGRVSLRFGGVRALADVSFAVRRGEVFSSIGPNGGGKTSMVNCVSGRYWPTEGRILFDGQDITRTGTSRRAALGVGRTFQNLALSGHITVLDNIMVGRHHLLRAGFLRGMTGPALTLPRRLRRNAQANGREVAMREKEFGIWRSLTWSEVATRTRDLALGLRALGVRAGEVVALIGDSRPDWVMGEIAAHAVRARSLGIYRDALDDEVAYLLAFSGATAVIAEDEEQVDKLLNVAGQVPGLRHIVSCDPRGMRKHEDPRLISAAELTRRGAALAASEPSLWDSLVDATDGEDVAILCATSGTTAPPKLAQLSARALILILLIRPYGLFGTATIWGQDAPGQQNVRAVGRVSDPAGTAFRPAHYPAGMCGTVLMVEATETAAAKGGQVTGERIRDGFHARHDWAPAGFEGACEPSNFTNTDHRGTMRVALYRAVVTGDATQGQVPDPMRAGTMRVEPVTTITLERRRDWLGW